MRRLLCLLAAVGLLSVAVPAGAQTEEKFRIVGVEREGDRITIEIVTPAGPLLTSDDFRVNVNGLTPEDLQSTPLEQAHRAAGAVVVVDTSGSMVGAPIREAKRAVAAFLDALEGRASVALVGFSDRPRVLTPFTTEHGRVRRQIPSLVATGETALYDGLVMGARLAAQRSPEQRNVVVLSDGADTASRASLNDAVRELRTTDASVIGVALQSPEYSGDTLREITSRTGGRLLTTVDPTRLASIFADLARTLASSYSIALENPDPAATQVEVEVAVVQDGVTLSATETLTLPIPDVVDPDAAVDLPWLADVPVTVILTLVFLLVVAAVFLATRLLTPQATPGRRVGWYTGAPAGDATAAMNTDELISAQVLERAKQAATDLAERAGALERIESEIDAAALKWKPGEVIVGSVLLGVVGTLVGFLVFDWVFAVIFGFVGFVGPAAWIKVRAGRRRARFYQQLPDVLLLIAGALRAGYSLQQAVAAVGEDATPPAADEFRRAMAEVRLGASLDHALDSMSQRLNIIDFDWTVLAIRIQREVGGNLAEIMETISATVRERERLKGHLKALTAEGRLSAWVLGILPFFMAGLLYLNSRDYLLPLFQERTGIYMMIGAGVLMLIGALWMRKIIRIEI